MAQSQVLNVEGGANPKILQNIQLIGVCTNPPHNLVRTCASGVELLYSSRWEPLRA